MSTSALKSVIKLSVTKHKFQLASTVECHLLMLSLLNSDSTVGVGYGNVVTMSPQYEYDGSPLLVNKTKVYITKQLQHLISQTPSPYIGKTTATRCN